MKKKTKTNMRATSLLAFSQILEDLGFKELQVFLAIKHLQPCSDKMLAEYLNWKINRITGRRYDLAKVGMIIQKNKDIDKVPPFKKVIFWIIPSYNNSILTNEFKQEVLL